jgi:hypothetical protein
MSTAVLGDRHTTCEGGRIRRTIRLHHGRAALATVSRRPRTGQVALRCTPPSNPRERPGFEFSTPQTPFACDLRRMPAKSTNCKPLGSRSQRWFPILYAFHATDRDERHGQPYLLRSHGTKATSGVLRYTHILLGTMGLVVSRTQIGSQGNFCRSVAVVFVCGACTTLASPGPSLAQAPAAQDEPAACDRFVDNIARERCYRSNAADLQSQQRTAAGQWRLVRTPNPQGGHDFVSVSRTPELSQSDIDFAGLMFRCGDIAPEMLIVLVRPLPVLSRPKVVVDAGSGSVKFTARVLSPGVLVLLPPEAAVLLTGPGPPRTAVKITVSDDSDDKVSITGVVRLDGLALAIGDLEAHCVAIK